MSIELKILDLIQILHTPFLDRLMCFVTKLGNAGAIWILAAAILLLIPKTRKTGAVVVVALLIDAILCNPEAFHRQNPPLRYQSRDLAIDPKT